MERSAGRSLPSTIEALRVRTARRRRTSSWRLPDIPVTWELFQTMRHVNFERQAPGLYRVCKVLILTVDANRLYLQKSLADSVQRRSPGDPRGLCALPRNCVRRLDPARHMADYHWKSAIFCPSGWGFAPPAPIDHAQAFVRA